jgi:hypothetical protein
MRGVRRVILLIGSAAALSAFGCEEPLRFDVTGTWTGGSAQDHSGREVMTLRQDDEDITGLVCRISSGHRVFFDVPVSGRYPRVTFAYFGDTVTGWATGEHLIVARRSGSVSYELRFTRTSTSEYEECHNAPP